MDKLEEKEFIECWKEKMKCLVIIFKIYLFYLCLIYHKIGI